VERARKNAELRGIKITQKIDAATLLIHGDSIIQLLDILLDNARKYGPRQGEITITGRKQNGQYLIQVQDQGPGIDEADLPHIFERLYRSDKARTSSTGGYGLGLALANEIAKANQGSISASNNKKVGACLSVRLEVA